MLSFSRLVVSDSLRPCGLQHARLSQGLLKFMTTESVMKTGMNSRSPTRVLSPNMVTISHISYFT